LDKRKYSTTGNYNYPNAMAAVCIGLYFGISAEHIKAALEAYTPDNNRSQFKKIGANDFILDAYNANPSSMQLAIENFKRMHATAKIAILGGMKELGTIALRNTYS
jgi:UDP-N-acetylmuramoyl-tripeptide--D-alanyl-D-alanine ligase